MLDIEDLMLCGEIFTLGKTKVILKTLGDYNWIFTKKIQGDHKVLPRLQ